VIIGTIFLVVLAINYFTADTNNYVETTIAHTNKNLGTVQENSHNNAVTITTNLKKIKKGVDNINEDFLSVKNNSAEIPNLLEKTNELEKLIKTMAAVQENFFDKIISHVLVFEKISIKNTTDIIVIEKQQELIISMLDEAKNREEPIPMTRLYYSSYEPIVVEFPKIVGDFLQSALPFLYILILIYTLFFYQKLFFLYQRDNKKKASSESREREINYKKLINSLYAFAGVFLTGLTQKPQVFAEGLTNPTSTTTTTSTSTTTITATTNELNSNIAEIEREAERETALFMERIRREADLEKDLLKEETTGIKKYYDQEYFEKIEIIRKERVDALIKQQKHPTEALEELKTPKPLDMDIPKPSKS